VTAGKRFDSAGVALFLLATGGSDLSPPDAVFRDFLLLDPVVLVAELVELPKRKPVTTTTTRSEQTYFICYKIVKIKVS
jgi:hypothetical protein